MNQKRDVYPWVPANQHELQGGGAKITGEGGIINILSSLSSFRLISCQCLLWPNPT